MHKRAFFDLGMRHKAYLSSLTIGFLVFLVVFYTQKSQEIESANGIQMGSNRSLDSMSLNKKELKSIISPEEAGSIALNSLQMTETGIELSHPNHHVTFESDGVLFEPRKGPDWKWQLTHIGTEEEPLKGLSTQSVRPENNDPRIVSYHYGNIVEEYHAKQNTVEQRFVLAEPLSLGGQDLVIKGRVESQGEFEKKEDGLQKSWTWSDPSGQVELGDVTVFDAEGQILMASMQVTAQSTEIIVDAGALAKATYPVTVDPEIGANDFRISDMGPDGSVSFGANAPEVAYNSTDHEYLVAWYGRDDISPLVQGESEIFCQRIDATTGAELGANDMRISDMGPDGDGKFNAFNPSIAYNSINNEYLIVWRGDDNTGSLVDNEIEVFGQLLAADGTEIGSDFRISDMGPDGDDAYDAVLVDVSHNSIKNEYLVVWDGDDTIDDRFEIYGQLLDANGGEIGSDFLISDSLPNEMESADARNPAVAYNSTDNQYIVVWENAIVMHPSPIFDEIGVFGQILNASGSKMGANFQIGDLEQSAVLFFDQLYPDVAYNSTDNEYLAVWKGEYDVMLILTLEKEILGQRLDTSGNELGDNDFRISDMGPEDHDGYRPFEPAITYNSIDNEYLVVWHGTDDTPPLVPGELEVFSQRLDNLGAELGENDQRISDMGPAGDTSTPAYESAVAHNSKDNEYLVVWSGDDNPQTLVNTELEIYGQRLLSTGPTLTVDIATVSVTGSFGSTTAILTLDAGPGNAFLPYIVLGSLSGGSPGTAIGDVSIPINPDTYTLFSINNFNTTILANNFGTLDANGVATISFSPPTNSTLIGLVATYAALILDPSQFAQQVVVDSSNAAAVHLGP